MQSLLRTRPRNLEDLTIQVAIVRPGPIQGGAINPYIERRQRLREDPAYEIPYEHPSLEPVLAETLGTIIFQDQVMEVAEAFAGFAPGEADGLRRAMSRKRSHEMLQRHRERFIEGRRHAARAVPTAQTAERVWAMVEGFAGFGFPKAHSAAFGLLAYQSTWLRVHYGAEFLCALLERAADGLLRPRQPRARGREPRDRGARARRQRLPRAVHGPGWGRAPGSRLHQGCGQGRDARAGGRARAGTGRSPASASSPDALRCTRGTLEQLAWSGACDSLIDASAAAGTALRAGTSMHSVTGHHAQMGAARRWPCGSREWPRLPISVGGELADGGEGTQLALPLELPPAPRLRRLGRWQRLIADYSTSGVTVGEHAHGDPARAPDRPEARHQRAAPARCPAAARWRWPGW